MPAVARPTLAAVALAALAAAGCAAPPFSAPAGALATPAAFALPPRAVFFGSSTTAGSGASTPERRWTTLLCRTLGWTEVNRGLPGSTLTDLGPGVDSAEERWRAALAGDAPDLVVVMYGANDVLAGVPLGDDATPETFRHAAAAVLHGIREVVPGAALIVLSPQPNRLMGGARGPYDRALEEEASAAGAAFVAAGAAFPEDRPDALAADGLHLSDAGHAALVAFLLDHRDAFARPPARAARPGGGAGDRHSLARPPAENVSHASSVPSS